MKKVIFILILATCILLVEVIATVAAEPGTSGAAAEESSAGAKGSPSKQAKKKTTKKTTSKTTPVQQAVKTKDSGKEPPEKSGKTTSPPDSAAAPANGAVLEHGFVGFSWPRTTLPPYQIQISRDPNFTSMVVNVSTSDASLVTSTELAPGTYYWRVQGKTAAGQNKKSPVRSFKVSATAPVHTMTDSFINNGMVSTNSATLSLALSAKGSSDIVAYAVWESTYASDPSELQSAPVTPAKPYADIIPFAASQWVSVTPTARYVDVISYVVSRGDGRKKISVRFKDKEGLISEAKSGVITLDTTLPDTTITDHPEDPSETTAASFSFTSTKPGSIFNCALDDGVFEACSSPWSYNGLLGGKHTIAVRATDAAGNIDPTPARFSWVTTSPVRNTTRPGFIALGSPVTYRDTVKLSMSAYSTTKPGISGYYISERADMPAITDPEWIKFRPVESFARDVEYTLSPGTGKKVVYVWFKDEAGNVSDVRIDTISRLNSTYIVLMFFLLQAMVML